MKRLWCKRRSWQIISGMRQFLQPLFQGRHFNHSIIILCVRWYITDKLSYRDLVEIMAERGVELAHTTILRWVQDYVPKFEKRWSKFTRPVGTSWRVDETYIKVRGRWVYLYRAVDKQGLTVDFLLSEHRDISAAQLFFTQAIKQHGPPKKITVDGYPVTQTAISELKVEEVLPQSTKVRTNKYLNNLIEQDHRRVKQRIYPMLGFKRFKNAAITISGIELALQLRKEQFATSRVSTSGARASEVWDAVLGA
jgi:transposase-like protein